jgi:hypothetical protein
VQPPPAQRREQCDASLDRFEAGRLCGGDDGGGQVDQFALVPPGAGGDHDRAAGPQECGAAGKDAGEPVEEAGPVAVGEIARVAVVALAVDALVLTAEVVDVISTGISIYNTVEDVRTGASAGQTAMDAASSVLGLAGVSLGGVKGLFKGAKDVLADSASAAKSAFGQASKAVSAASNLANRGGAAGRAAQSGLLGLRQAKNAARAVSDQTAAWASRAATANAVAKAANVGWNVAQNPALAFFFLG